MKNEWNWMGFLCIKKTCMNPKSLNGYCLSCNKLMENDSND